MIDKTRATGLIRDISLGGLAFVYNPIEGHTFADRAIETLTIDYSGFQLWDISCDKIYDIRALSEGQTFSGADDQTLRGALREPFHPQQVQDQANTAYL